MKKADLSINVIIVTIIALVVLVVLIFTFTGKLSLFNAKINQCKEIQGYLCEEQCDESQGYIQDHTKVCLDGKNNPNPSQRCCIPYLKQADTEK